MGYLVYWQLIKLGLMEEVTRKIIDLKKDVKKGLRILAAKEDIDLKHYIQNLLEKHVDENVKKGNIKL